MIPCEFMDHFFEDQCYSCFLLEMIVIMNVFFAQVTYFSSPVEQLVSVWANPVGLKMNFIRGMLGQVNFYEIYSDTRRQKKEVSLLYHLLTISTEHNQLLLLLNTVEYSDISHKLNISRVVTVFLCCKYIYSILLVSTSLNKRPP